MFRRIAAKVPEDRDYPPRAREITIRQSVLDGTLYDVLPYEFYEEYNDTGEYVPIRDRAPNARSNLCRVVVDDSVALLFSEGHFPAVVCDDETTHMALEALIADARLAETMMSGATMGSVGSVAFLMRVLNGRAFVREMATTYLTPAWNPEAPDTLLSVQERYKVNGAELRARGYRVADDDLRAPHWFQREWNEVAENWFLPQKIDRSVEAMPPPVIDAARSVTHGLGFVPIVWVRNLPGGDEIDGECTFRLGIDDQIAIDYQLSQAGRGLTYSSDPTFVVKEPASDGGQIVRSASNALIVSKDGDAKVLEISGTASGAVIEYCRAIREMALEAMHGNRADPQKFSGAQSGRALEWLNTGLVQLADKLRASYGEGGLLALLRMIVAASQKYPLTVAGKRVMLSPDASLSLRWPAWYPPTWTDKQAEASTMQTLVNAGVVSQETATAIVADTYDIEDVAAERATIVAETELEQARALALKPPPMPQANLPPEK